MQNPKKNITGINKAIICKKCGHRVGMLKMKPALLDLLAKKNRRETLLYVFLIALVVEITAQFISDIIFKIF